MKLIKRNIKGSFVKVFQSPIFSLFQYLAMTPVLTLDKPPWESNPYPQVDSKKGITNTKQESQYQI